MEKQKIYETLKDKLLASKVEIDEPMNKHTSFKIGGNADIYVTAKTCKDIQTTLLLAKEKQIPFVVLGNGSNLLVGDKGIRGIVLKVATEEISIQKEQEYAYVMVQAGEPLAKLARVLLKENITGFEFAAGIPGTIGGGISMNAGAYGGEMKDIVKEITYLNEEGNSVTIPNEKCDFSYRHSYFSSHFGIITQVCLQLPYGKEEEIKSKMDEYAKNRKEKQPLAYPSAGSTFKRGNDFITAKLIDECGLKGYTVGKAQVSNLHAGFVINLGGATAKDVLNVIKHVKQEVLLKTGKSIELEIKLLGEF